MATEGREWQPAEAVTPTMDHMYLVYAQDDGTPGWRSGKWVNTRFSFYGPVYEDHRGKKVLDPKPQD